MVTIVYSVMHTGTWFCIKLLQTILKDAEVVPMHPKGKALFLGTETPDRPVILHYHHVGDDIYEALVHPDWAGTVCLVPLRDPWLALLSRIWRDCDYSAYRDYPTDRRVEFAKTICRSFCEVLALPAERTAWISIDRHAWLAEQRCQAVLAELAYLGLDATEQTQEYLHRWPLVNPTVGPTDHPLAEAMRQRFQRNSPELFRELKLAHLERNWDLQKEFLPIEWDAMMGHDDLWYALEPFGYERPVS